MPPIPRSGLPPGGTPPGARAHLALRRGQPEPTVPTAPLAALNARPQQPPPVRIAWEIRMLQDDIRALWARPLIED